MICKECGEVAPPAAVDEEALPTVDVIGYEYWSGVLIDALERAGFDAQYWRIKSKKQSALVRLCPPLGVLPFAALPWTRRFNQASVIHNVGTFPSKALYSALRMARIKGKRIFMHWIGTDVLEFTSAARAGNTNIVDFFREIPHQHFGMCPHLIEELAEFGVHAELWPLLPERIVSERVAAPMPEKPAVLAYWPADRRDFYGGPVLDALADAFPDVQFYVVGSDGQGEPQHPNIEYLGWQNLEGMEDVYAKVSALVRVTEHDGLPGMMLEMLARGRWVVHSNAFPHADLAGDFEQARAALRECLARSGANDAGRQYVLNEFTPEAEARRIEPIYRRLLTVDLEELDG